MSETFDSSNPSEVEANETTLPPVNEEQSGEERKLAGRELPVSTLIHLLGLPTAGEVNVLESKIDMLMAKMSALSSKVDRLSNQIGTIANEYYIDRIDFQIAEIRTLMKKVFPTIVSSGDFVGGPIRDRKKKSDAEGEGSEGQAADSATGSAKE